MNKLLVNSFLIVLLTFLQGCRHSDSSFVKVYKSDGSIQCESSGAPLEVMVLELSNAGIDVICSQKGHDGLARIAVCGAPTGNLNIYRIQARNLKDAESLGFESVAKLSEYRDQECE